VLTSSQSPHPSCALYSLIPPSITMWYRRHECGFRMALFFSAATCAGAFGGLLARGIMEMDGVGGRAGWSWIFILEGLATLAVAIAAFFLMADYPSTAKFLKPEERREISRRLAEDQSDLAEEFQAKYVWDAVKDWKIWVHMFITIRYDLCFTLLHLVHPANCDSASTPHFILSRSFYRLLFERLATPTRLPSSCLFRLMSLHVSARSPVAMLVTVCRHVACL
jgi:MFS family permease